MNRLEDLEVYQLAEGLADYVWSVVVRWEWFAKRTVGGQLVEAADSVAANVAEGHGRFHYADNRRFCFYARGSFEETRNWLRRAAQRKLLTPEQTQVLSDYMRKLGPKLNAYIRSIGPTHGCDTPTNAKCPMPSAGPVDGTTNNNTVHASV